MNKMNTPPTREQAVLAIRENRCAWCGKPFQRNTDYQIFCSHACGDRSRNARNAKKIDYYARALRDSLTFECANCGKSVTTTPEDGDKRSKFCSAQCEKTYWKYKYKLDQKFPSRQNFHSFNHYANYEKYTNRMWG